MKFTFIVCVLAVLAAMALALTPAQRQHFQQIVHEVNNKQSGWVAELPETLMDSDYTSIHKMMGALRLPEGVNVLPVITHDEIDIASVPTDFDAATDLRWTECADILSTIPDQSACGSCWAVSTAQAASGRHCIATQGKSKVYLSARDLMSCCEECGNGCNGGYPEMAYEYIKQTGLVTGSWDNKNNSYCLKYPFLSCMHHTAGSPQCSDYDFDTPQCVHSCDAQSTWPISWKQDKIRFSSAYSLRNEADIMKDVYQNGPITVSFAVYEDLLSYRSGTYRHVSGSLLGYHAVSLVGWGVDTDGTKYWKIANNWNKNWGMNGRFNIVRGVDECGIESSANAGLP